MRLTGLLSSVVLALSLPCAAALAQTRDNQWIADQIEQGGGSLLATVAVFLAAVLMAIGLIRKSGH